MPKAKARTWPGKWDGAPNPAAPVRTPRVYTNYSQRPKLLRVTETHGDRFTYTVYETWVEPLVSVRPPNEIQSYIDAHPCSVQWAEDPDRPTLVAWLEDGPCDGESHELANGPTPHVLVPVKRPDGSYATHRYRWWQKVNDTTHLYQYDPDGSQKAEKEIRDFTLKPLPYGGWPLPGDGGWNLLREQQGVPYRYKSK